MNSAVVNRAIRSQVWPLMKTHGFSSFTCRTAWRDREHLIDIVNFQSFNRYHADVMGCTTFSFAVNLSIYLADVPTDYPPPVRNEQLRPAEYAGHIRRRLLPAHPRLREARDIWFVEEHGHNTSEIVAEAAAALTETAEPWFAAFDDRRSVLSILRDATEPPDELTWLPGATDSPARNTSLGYLALALGERSLAAKHLRRALEQYRAFDASSAKISRHSGRVTPKHLESAVARLASESA